MRVRTTVFGPWSKNFDREVLYHRDSLWTEGGVGEAIEWIGDVVGRFIPNVSQIDIRVYEGRPNRPNWNGPIGKPPCEPTCRVCLG